MKKVLMISVLIVLLSSTASLADCNTMVSGVIDGEEWTLEGSPYCVEGDILIKDLKIKPGVSVIFLGDYVFQVGNQPGDVLTAVGTDEAPIVFKADSAPTGQGILFDHSPVGSQLEYCQIHDSLNSGIRIYNSTPTIKNCTITDNYSNDSGGGMNIVLDTDTELLLQDCTISNNHASTHGGGIWVSSSTGSLTLKYCKINNNHANYNNSTGNYYGGGIYVDSAAGGLSLICCDISDNYSKSRCSINYCGASCYGGGVYISKGNVSFSNCIVASNTAAASNSGYRSASYSYGGGISVYQGALELTNCIISHNSPTASTSCWGGGIYDSVGTVALENCTVAYNTANGINNGGGIVTLINSIVYFNSDQQISGNAIATYSDVYMPNPDDVYPGEGNINEDPLFESPLNLRIRCDYSSCVDTGSPQPWYKDICFPPCCGTEANDMGAHGGPGACGWCVGGCCDKIVTKPIKGDLGGDGDVDAADLVIFSANYGIEACF